MYIAVCGGIIGESASLHKRGESKAHIDDDESYDERRESVREGIGGGMLAALVRFTTSLASIRLRLALTSITLTLGFLLQFLKHRDKCDDPRLLSRILTCMKFSSSASGSLNIIAYGCTYFQRNRVRPWRVRRSSNPVWNPT